MMYLARVPACAMCKCSRDVYYVQGCVLCSCFCMRARSLFGITRATRRRALLPARTRAHRGVPRAGAAAATSCPRGRCGPGQRGAGAGGVCRCCQAGPLAAWWVLLMVPDGAYIVLHFVPLFVRRELSLLVVPVLGTWELVALFGCRCFACSACGACCNAALSFKTWPEGCTHPHLSHFDCCSSLPPAPSLMFSCSCICPAAFYDALVLPPPVTLSPFDFTVPLLLAHLCICASAALYEGLTIPHTLATHFSLPFSSVIAFVCPSCSAVRGAGHSSVRHTITLQPHVSLFDLTFPLSISRFACLSDPQRCTRGWSHCWARAARRRCTWCWRR